jgi:hypothetical protein
MGSINFAAPFQFLRSIAAPQLVADPNYLWVRQKSDGQVVSVLPGDFDPQKHDKL